MEARDEYPQISIGLSNEAGALVAAQNANQESRAAELKAMHSSLLRSTSKWLHGTYRQGSPYPILMNQHQLDGLETLHDLLNIAIVDIVERWWTDEEARFPERMPIECQEEDLLKWIAEQSTSTVRPYKDCQGSWRPDFLVDMTGRYRICEINGRFAFNAYLHSAYGQQAHIDRDNSINPPTIPALEPKKVYDGLLDLFDTSLPLHLLKGDEIGLDIHLFVDFVHATIGQRPRLVTPDQLRLEPDDTSPTGSTLFCVTGVAEDGSEIRERIYQVGLELHQHELRMMSQAMLREISTLCFNDFRTVFLVHDKRMLGIVLEDLNSLVNRKMLTPMQAKTLQDGMTPTNIPGSPDITRLIEDSIIDTDLKDKYILKPIRSGKGKGIIFGTDMKEQDWLSELRLLTDPGLVKDKTRYVVQLHIDQPRYDILLPGAEKLQRNYLVGTYMAVHGKYVGIGTWRTSSDRICAVSHGGAWICSVISARNTTGGHLHQPIWERFTLPSSLLSLWRSLVNMIAWVSPLQLYVVPGNGSHKSSGK